MLIVDRNIQLITEWFTENWLYGGVTESKGRDFRGSNPDLGSDLLSLRAWPLEQDES